MKQTSQKINIAGLIINVYIDGEFNNIKEFISKFQNIATSNQYIATTIYISKNKERKVELSKDWNTLLIMGNKIDDLADPFNLIGITQAIFRFAAIHLAKRNVFLLHGSAAILNNEIICFGDDGDSTAKTLGSLEIALTSNQYIADEFCFIDIKNLKLFSYSFIPIHLRPIVKKHLQTLHDLKLPVNNYKNTVAGDFIQPDELFSLTSGKLKILSYIHFSEKGNILEKLSMEDAYKSFKFCIASHIAKLLYPELDRMQFASMTDSDTTKIVSEDLVDDIIKKMFDDRFVLEFVKKITSYKLTVSQPCQIVSFLKAEI